jgi:O-antigen/teichoic acid export membrane protein
MVASGKELNLHTLYHKGAQIITVLMGSAVIVLILFGRRVLHLWTGDMALSQRVAPLVATMAFGVLLNGLLYIPFQMQLAHGWTSLVVKLNAIAVCMLVPSLLLVVPAYGPIGAARCVVVLNAGILIGLIVVMHRYILHKEMWHWVIQDVTFPLLAAGAVAALCYRVMPYDSNNIGELCILLFTSLCTLLCSAAAAPLIRRQVAQYLHKLYFSHTASDTASSI